MGQSTNGQICFGVPFEEGYKFPWDNEKYNGCPEDWWHKEICGYKPPFELYTDNGYIGGIKPPKEKIYEYYAAKKAFNKEHQPPIELVNYCSAACIMLIVAIPKTCKENFRGSPKEFLPSNLIVTYDEQMELIAFCVKYCKSEDEYSKFPKMVPKWYLSSYWG